MKSRTYVLNSFTENFTSVIINNPAAKSKTYTRTGIILSVIQPLKNVKDLFRVLSIKSDPIVRKYDGRMGQFII